jgi:hypothetical protein
VYAPLLLLSVRNAYHALLITVVTCSPPQKVCGRNFQKKSISVKLVKKRKREYRIDSSLSESKAIESGVVNNPITTDKLNVLVSKKKIQIGFVSFVVCRKINVGRQHNY